MTDLSSLYALFDVKETFFTVFDSPVSYVEFIGTVLGLISVFLAARANILTWPTGIANAIFFLVIFYQIHLYSDMFLQCYFCGMGVYGWFSWKYKADHQQSAIRTLSKKERLLLAAFIAVVTLVIGTLISQIHLILPQVFDQLRRHLAQAISFNRLYCLNLPVPYALCDLDSTLVEQKISDRKRADLAGTNSSFREYPQVGFVGFRCRFDETLHLVE